MVQDLNFSRGEPLGFGWIVGNREERNGTNDDGQNTFQDEDPCLKDEEY